MMEAPPAVDASLHAAVLTDPGCPILSGAKAASYGKLGGTGEPLPAESRNRAVAVAGLVYLCAAGEGYDVGTFAAVLVRVQEVFGLERSSLGLLAALVYAGMVAGATVAGTLADLAGRRRALCAACVLLVVGALTMGLAPSIQWLFAGRVIMGAGMGLGIPLGSLYIVETSPPELRGTLGAGFGAVLSVGVAIGGILAAVLQDIPGDWRVMLLLGALPPTVVLFGLWRAWLPESPRWLAARGNLGAAREALERLGSDEVSAQKTLKELELTAVKRRGHRHGDEAWAVIFPAAAHRPRILTALGMLCSTYLCGYVSCAVYLPVLLKADLGRRMAVTVAAGISSSTAVTGLLSARLPDLWGRRPLLLLGYALLVVMFLQFSLATSPWGAPPGARRGWWLAIWFGLGSSAFVGAVGPVSLFYSAEVLPSALRASGMGMGNAAARLIALCLTLALPICLEASTWLTFAALAGSNLLILCFLSCVLQETRGMDLEEIDRCYGDTCSSKSAA